jgi:uncharacterized protein YbjQ (UPF0145 family)
VDQDPAAWAPTPGSARLRAQQPGASGNGSWEPVLTTGEFAAIRSAGFEMVGRVSGADVYSLAAVNAGQCPLQHPLWARRYGTFPTEVSSLRLPDASFAPLVAALYNARRAAIGRVLEKGRALGGHGVIGVRLESLDDPVSGPGFAATGTVVRAPGVPRPQYLFTAQLSGQDFARLVTRGWIPVGLVLGIAIGVRHAIDATVGQPTWAQGPGEQARFCTANMEDDGITHLVNVTRQEARGELARHAQRLGADGVVLAGQDLNLFHRECPSDEGGRDCCAEVISIGTAITRFAETAHAAGSPPLAVMSVDPQRRQAARANPFPVPPSAPKRALGEDAAVASIDGVQ